LAGEKFKVLGEKNVTRCDYAVVEPSTLLCAIGRESPRIDEVPARISTTVRESEINGGTRDVRIDAVTTVSPALFWDLT
jgi:hypothetical protein